MTAPKDRTPAENAQLALLLDVAGTPKPGNVDRERDLEDLRFEHFLAGAVGSGEGLRRAESGAPVGAAFERAVAGMSRQRGGNTQFGCLLLLVPLVRAAADGSLSPEGATAVAEATTVADAVEFYRAFEHVDVAVEDPPEDAAELDVRRGGDAAPALRTRELTLYDVMALSEDDGNAREWTGGFARTFDAAESMLEDDGPAPDRVARAFVDLLAEEEDTLVRTNHGPEVAAEARRRAAEARGDPEAVAELAEAFVAEGINPGTTADIACAATFVALERGMPV
ncbi:triphosphoribosyl-dephospho-CoA synthase [Halopelagius longus]|uniref:Triphosphoribosyl-dephospho-CoA synthase n=1 Tax=Halopelagius longus TaxID=1236180 RepID=A0A1H0YW81_9EURY|nr:triphosphoribosyl-dephospho-CoA synthase [Halopelagius longus]RDI72695.1 triphosphoribosyl-dephospho-CoA synthase [Halopelagius longus]SDQ19106.1 triphosphoribosyl-dephospho-CoA synthase [Halopelagius longus]